MLINLKAKDKNKNKNLKDCIIVSTYGKLVSKKGGILPLVRKHPYMHVFLNPINKKGEILQLVRKHQDMRVFLNKSENEPTALSFMAYGDLIWCEEKQEYRFDCYIPLEKLKPCIKAVQEDSEKEIILNITDTNFFGFMNNLFTSVKFEKDSNAKVIKHDISQYNIATNNLPFVSYEGYYITSENSDNIYKTISKLAIKKPKEKIDEKLVRLKIIHKDKEILTTQPTSCFEYSFFVDYIFYLSFDYKKLSLPLDIELPFKYEYSLDNGKTFSKVTGGWMNLMDKIMLMSPENELDKTKSKPFHFPNIKENEPVIIKYPEI